MIKPAQLYIEELKIKQLETWYDEKNIYYSGWVGDSLSKIDENNEEWHQFVSVDKNNNVIGYISYGVDWVTMTADRFGIISFDKGNIEFAKDLYKVICDIFEKYNMNRMSWYCIADNPAIRGYRNFIKRYGGKECGYYRQCTKLQDGKLHDTVIFEIISSEFKKEDKNEKRNIK